MTMRYWLCAQSRKKGRAPPDFSGVYNFFLRNAKYGKKFQKSNGYKITIDWNYSAGVRMTKKEIITYSVKVKQSEQSFSLER
jgi:hypothetical protein